MPVVIPEIDYPLDDEVDEEAIAMAERLFDSSDLPRVPRGDFPRLSPAMLSRVKQLPEVAGVTDGVCEHQPLLCRFTRYNHSMMNARPIPQCRTACTPSSSAPLTVSKSIGSRLKSGMFGAHWTFRDKRNPDRASIRNITVVPVGGREQASVRVTLGALKQFDEFEQTDTRHQGEQRRSTSQPAVVSKEVTFNSRVPFETRIPIQVTSANNNNNNNNTYMMREIPIRLETPRRQQMHIATRLRKSGSAGNVLSEARRMDDDASDEHHQHGDPVVHHHRGSSTSSSQEESPPLHLRKPLMRRIGGGGAKSVGPGRRVWRQVTPALDDVFSDHKTNAFNMSPNDDNTEAARFTIIEASADSAYRSDSSESPTSHHSGGEQRKSCPDLRGEEQRFLPRVNSPMLRNQRAKEKRLAALWQKKAVVDWSLDDLLLWLQHEKLDEVASLVIGYDLSGRDLLQWDDQALGCLGVVDLAMRRRVLAALERLKEDKTIKTKPQSRVPLFKLVRSSSYDQVVAVETSLTNRDITLAEGRLGCLQVTKVNGNNLPLQEGDCLLEINSRPGQAFRSPLSFTKLINEAEGAPIRLVVLRRRPAIHDAPEEDRRTTLEQESTASSGISSNEFPHDQENQESRVCRF